MNKSYLTRQAADQIRTMAEVLRITAHQHEAVFLPSLVLALAPRLIELADALSCAELSTDDGLDPIPDFRTVVYGPQTADAGA